MPVDTLQILNAKAIASLISDKKGIIWGMADGIVIFFDPAKLKVLSTLHAHLVTPKQKESNVWHNASNWGALAVIFTEQQGANYSNLIMTLLN